ncbi:sensor histidine kinase [Phytoactinopolyspora mesophila]|uniref:histidine kinase n=1 Tax=Phytoactinopolyspora mesophila TaxID=2650750 RepID=A0A7K3M405_9ACTN|nr:histidine kinase [Phytoactinopolyspora mesophila]NDL57950.1 histidine kinase [Phytoactinopolyspora mesophila]
MEHAPADHQVRGQRLHWSLPGELAVPDDEHTPGSRRTLRDWAADVALFGAAAAFWAPTLGDPTPSAPDVPDWFVTVDPWVGAAACLALWLRRRFPVALVLGLIPVLVVSDSAFGAAMVAVLTVAVHRRWQTAALVTAPYVVMGALAGYAYPDPDLTRRGTMITVVLMFLVPLVSGIAIRSRRQLVVSLHRDAERQRREHERRLGESRRAEREQIAHEMHDVLAHRISLLSVHAGALAYRAQRTEEGAAPAMDPAEIGEAVVVIRDNANHALTELGEVLRVLRWGRSEHDGHPAALPQPKLADLERLIDEAEAVGQQVTLEPGSVLDNRDLVPARVQRTAYRVVQEGLTNARKHAPGQPVVVRLDGAAADGLRVTVTNPLAATVIAREANGAGVGLTGLAERVTLDDGTFEHGVRDGGFEVRAQLPWPDDRAAD